MPDDFSSGASDERSSVRTVSLGCRLNAHESERMASLAAGAGLENAVIVNSCAVTAEAVRQSRQAVRRAHRESPEAVLLVTGCAAQIDPRGFAALEGVDAVIGNALKLRPESYRQWGQQPVDGSAEGRLPEEPFRRTGSVSGGRRRATVQIQNGCDHACTFCIIPQGRGRARSVPVDRLVEEVASLSDKGHAEIVLTGVDLTSWGQDLPGQPRLGDLLAALLEAVPELPCIRLSSVDVAEIDDRLEALLGQERRLAPYLHLSLQSGDDMILKRMKRRHTSAQAVALCERLRAARPDFAFGADLIAGFPTETEAMFVNTLATMRACGLDYWHVFPFSARPGTPAARMPPVPGARIRERAARLRQEGQICLSRRLARHVGQTRQAIMEGDNRARLPDFAPVRLRREAAQSDERARAPIRLLGHDGQRLMGVLA